MACSSERTTTTDSSITTGITSSLEGTDTDFETGLTDTGCGTYYIQHWITTAWGH